MENMHYVVTGLSRQGVRNLVIIVVVVLAIFVGLFAWIATNQATLILDQAKLAAELSESKSDLLALKIILGKMDYRIAASKDGMYRNRIIH
jgi:hypothetical protein